MFEISHRGRIYKIPEPHDCTIDETPEVINHFGSSYFEEGHIYAPHIPLNLHEMDSDGNIDTPDLTDENDEDLYLERMGIK